LNGRRADYETVGFGEAWTTAAAAAGLHDFQLRDLRHEAGSPFDEAGTPIAYIGTMLGHSNLSTTSRYLNINRRGLHIAMQNFDASRTPRAADPARPESVTQPLHTTDDSQLAVVRGSALEPSRNTLPS
jgi:integrase-like protein